MSLDIDDPWEWDTKMRALRRMMKYSMSPAASGGGPATPASQPIQFEDGAPMQGEDGAILYEG